MPPAYNDDVSPTTTLATSKAASSASKATTSPPITPPLPQHRAGDKKPKNQKSTVGHAAGGRLHTRVASSKALHKGNKSATNVLAANTGPKAEVDPFEVGRLGLPSAKQTSASSTNLKKNNSHASLRRNRSSVDVPRRPKSSSSSLAAAEAKKGANNVHFEVGEDEDNDDEEGDGDGWEEASSSASPALSRSGTSSAKYTAANNSRNQSAPQSPSPRGGGVDLKKNMGGSKAPTGPTASGIRPSTPKTHTADAKIITERLLQRTPSYNTTKMSMATAVPSAPTVPTTPTVPSTSTTKPPSSISPSKKQSYTSTLGSTGTMGSKEGEHVVSRFMTGSGTPGENTAFLPNRRPGPAGRGHSRGSEEVKRAQSMGNLAHHKSPDHNSDGGEEDEEEETRDNALAPHTRNPSTATNYSHSTEKTHAYIPPQQSRTQQKLWLQRASSNIEPHGSSQMIGAAPNSSMLNAGPGGGMPSSISVGGMHLHGLGLGAAPSGPLLGAGAGGQYGEARDPRIKIALERTGSEFLVVRRHVDPVDRALRRGEERMGKGWKIPKHLAHGSKAGSVVGTEGDLGLSQSLKETGTGGRHRTKEFAQSSGNGKGKEVEVEDEPSRGCLDDNPPPHVSSGSGHGHGGKGKSKARDEDDEGIVESGGGWERWGARGRGRGLRERDMVLRERDPVDGGVAAILRGMWEKRDYEYSNSAD